MSLSNLSGFEIMAAKKRAGRSCLMTRRRALMRRQPVPHVGKKQLAKRLVRLSGGAK